MGQVPYCVDSTMITKSRLMFSVECYQREIRLIQIADDGHPRLALVDRSDPNSHKHLFFEVSTDTAFEELWKALATVAKPIDTEKYIIRTATSDNNNIKGKE